MESLTVVGPAGSWARDFALIGALTGALAPFFVIFDPVFALGAGAAGAATGALFGAGAARTIRATRRWLPLSAMAAGMAALGSLWGAFSGAFGGALAAAVGASSFGEEAVILGFICGGCSGMVQIGGLFLPYLLGAVHRTTWPVVGLAALASPFMGWAGLAALVGSTFGLWLFALPFVVGGAVLLETSVYRARLTARGRELRPSRSRP